MDKRMKHEKKKKEREREGRKERQEAPYKGKGTLAPKRKPTTNKGRSRPSH